MKKRIANCPACGAPVEFQSSSALVKVCEFCNSVIARGDKQVEDHGKVADVTQTQSPLTIGMEGAFGSKHFTVLGRVQYQHAAGGVWDEWYLLFPGDRWGWLAEAAGRFYLTSEMRLKSDFRLPAFDQVELGETFKLKGVELGVTEKGTATVRAAEGEIPWAVRPGAAHRYADLRDAEGRFATIEFDEDSPRVYVGESVELDELHLQGDQPLVDQEPIEVGGLQLDCPNCGGPLRLHAPDETQRVVCPNCASMLDASDGKLQYLKTLSQKQVHPVVPLGSRGTLRGTEYFVIGFMERYATYAGDVYPWTEYLLYNRKAGFRWLVENQRHWSFVEPVDLPVRWPPPDSVYYKDRTYRVYDRGEAIVRYVLGEFYWRVAIGERVRTADLISPPYMLSFERSLAGGEDNAWAAARREASAAPAAAEEINVSHASYLSIEELEQAFKVKVQRRPWGVGPIQPPPKAGYQVWLLWAAFIAAVVLIHIVFSNLRPTNPPAVGLLVLAIIALSLMPGGFLAFLYAFEVKRWENSDYSPYAKDD